MFPKFPEGPFGAKHNLVLIHGLAMLDNTAWLLYLRRDSTTAAVPEHYLTDSGSPGLTPPGHAAKLVGQLPWVVRTASGRAGGPITVTILSGISSNQQEGPIPLSILDHVLATQIVVAWAGEGGETPRLGWWRTDLVSDYGGKDLFRRLLPNTWEWATLQAVREAGRRTDAHLRNHVDDADGIVSLFCLGFEIDEKLNERLAFLKRSGKSPEESLPLLRDAIGVTWDRDRFLEWVRAHGEVEVIATPTGRRIKGAIPGGLDSMVQRLVAGLFPLAEAYPMPHFKRAA